MAHLSLSSKVRLKLDGGVVNGEHGRRGNLSGIGVFSIQAMNLAVVNPVQLCC